MTDHTPEPWTYARAKLVIWNPEAYGRSTVRSAAIHILGTLSARQEDLDQAGLLL